MSRYVLDDYLVQSATRGEIRDPTGRGTTVAESFVLIPLPRYCV